MKNKVPYFVESALIYAFLFFWFL